MATKENHIKTQSNFSCMFNTLGIWQGDALACLLFNTSLESIISRSELGIQSYIKPLRF